MSEQVPRRLATLAHALGWGDPCCKLTESGKHQADCPRIADDRLAVLKDAVRPVLAAYRSHDTHVTKEQITRAWEAFDRG